MSAIEVDAVELLRRFCIDDPSVSEERATVRAGGLDERTTALVRLGALIALAAPSASMGAAVDDAVSAGVSAEEIVAVLARLAGIVGSPRVVAAAPRIAMALGYDDELLDVIDV